MLPGFDITIAPDRMTAMLAISAEAKPAAAEVIALAREMKLTFDDGVLTETLKKRKPGPLSVEIARGTPPVDERPSEVEYQVPVAVGDVCSIAKVEANQIVATLTPGQPGVDGKDVFGTAVPFRTNRLQIGRNLKLNKGGLVSAIRGNFRLRDDLLTVEPLLEIADEKSRPDPIHFDGDAVARGGLHDGRQINLTGGLWVRAAMEAVCLVAGGSVLVKGGVIGKHQGHYTIGGDLRCRYISGGIFAVTGNVEVQSEIVHSRISCLGRLSVLRGPIYGGDVVANGGIRCHVLGHASGVPTLVEAGPGNALREFAAGQINIDNNIKRIAEVRGKIAPLMALVKQLSPAQRERATELLTEADELETVTREMIETLEHRTRSVRDLSRAEIEVSTLIHPGVVVRFEDRETLIPAPIEGPVKLTHRKVAGLTEIVLIDLASKSETPLSSRPIAPPAAVSKKVA